MIPGSSSKPADPTLLCSQSLQRQEICTEWRRQVGAGSAGVFCGTQLIRETHLSPYHSIITTG